MQYHFNISVFINTFEVIPVVLIIIVPALRRLYIIFHKLITNRTVHLHTFGDHTDLTCCQEIKNDNPTHCSLIKNIKSFQDVTRILQIFFLRLLYKIQ